MIHVQFQLVFLITYSPHAMFGCDGHDDTDNDGDNVDNSSVNGVDNDEI